MRPSIGIAWAVMFGIVLWGVTIVLTLALRSCT
jgi:hypothetical protein